MLIRNSIQKGIAALKKQQNNRSIYQSLAMIAQFGINMLVPICILSAIGIFLDNKLGTSYIMILLFFVGAVAGGRNIYHMAKQVYKTTEEEDSAEAIIRQHRKTGKTVFSERKPGKEDGNTGKTTTEE
ncbi:AtpZ/AtpI family protein [Lachnospiraceae bacterium OttesenSCG-928-D06]|nr:AtpZ/AtpI family protein [Lachnospiraceae bacterium OttesenSCG-928-D06]